MSDDYFQRQNEWVAKYDIIPGDQLRITRRADPEERGWPNSWEPSMEESIGRTYQVDYIDKYGIWLEDGFAYPYFILELASEDLWL